MTRAEYHQTEATREHNAIIDCERQPLAVRREARDAWRECLTDRRADYSAGDYLRERIAWIANGSYGAGAVLVTRSKLRNCTTALQRRALLFCTIARLDHSCPERFAIGVWGSLPAELQREVDAACDDAAATFEADSEDSV